MNSENDVLHHVEDSPVFVLVLGAAEARRTHDFLRLSVFEKRNDVRRAHDQRRVQESERAFLIRRHERDLREPAWLEAPLFAFKEREPSHPKEVHGLEFRLGRSRSFVLDICVENATNTSVPERVSLDAFVKFFGRDDHHVGVGARIDRVLVASHVVRSVVYAHSLVAIHPALLDDHLIALRV